MLHKYQPFLQEHGNAFPGDHFTVIMLENPPSPPCCIHRNSMASNTVVIRSIYAWLFFMLCNPTADFCLWNQLLLRPWVTAAPVRICPHCSALLFASLSHYLPLKDFLHWGAGDWHWGILQPKHYGATALVWLRKRTFLELGQGLT